MWWGCAARGAIAGPGLEIGTVGCHAAGLTSVPDDPEAPRSGRRPGRDARAESL
jgi:hypothetical protein